MDAVLMLRRGAEHIAQYGLERGRRLDYETGAVCALGALDVVSFVARTGRMPSPAPWEPVTEFSYGEEYMRAVEALSVNIPAGGFDNGPDPHNKPVDPSDMSDPGSRVAWYANTHTKAAVLDWFERSAVSLELGAASKLQQIIAGFEQLKALVS